MWQWIQSKLGIGTRAIGTEPQNEVEGRQKEDEIHAKKYEMNLWAWIQSKLGLGTEANGTEPQNEVDSRKEEDEKIQSKLGLGTEGKSTDQKPEQNNKAESPKEEDDIAYLIKDHVVNEVGREKVAGSLVIYDSGANETTTISPLPEGIEYDQIEIRPLPRLPSLRLAPPSDSCLVTNRNENDQDEDVDSDQVQEEDAPGAIKIPFNLISWIFDWTR